MNVSLVLFEAFVLQVPTPTDPPFDPDDVTPGVVGFAAIFILFLMVSAISFDLIRRVRRVKYREVVREKLEREVAERDGRRADADAVARDERDEAGAERPTPPDTPRTDGDTPR